MAQPVEFFNRLLDHGFSKSLQNYQKTTGRTSRMPVAPERLECRAVTLDLGLLKAVVAIAAWGRYSGRVNVGGRT